MRTAARRFELAKALGLAVRLEVIEFVELTHFDFAVHFTAERRRKADTDGTGNVNDLLRESTASAGLPAKEVLADGEYASSVNGQVVRIAQAAYVDGAESTPKVDAAADAALSLKLG